MGTPGRRFDLTVQGRLLKSYAIALRQKRFGLFKSLLASLPRPVSIIDVGGTEAFWEEMQCTDDSLRVWLVNLKTLKTRRPNFISLIGDATDLADFEDGSFDVAFSNSVIEHVGGDVQQQRMAHELRRVSRRYFVQTPNYFFPIEPHFCFPGFQFLPVSARALLLRNFTLGWFTRTSDRQAAQALVESISLLKRCDFAKLFPEATIVEEKFLGLTKSFVAHNGWENTDQPVERAMVVQ